MGKQIYCKHKGCYQLVDSGVGYCDEHIKDKDKASRSMSDRQYNNERPERHQFYHTKAWKQLRKRKVAMTPYCERCRKNGVLRPVEIVHHIIEIEEDWDLRLDINNLESVCRRCHNEIHSKKIKEENDLKRVIEKYK